MVVGDGRTHAEVAVREAEGAGEGPRLLHCEPFSALIEIELPTGFLSRTGFGLRLYRCCIPGGV